LGLGPSAAGQDTGEEARARPDAPALAWAMSRARVRGARGLAPPPRVEWRARRRRCAASAGRRGRGAARAGDGADLSPLSPGLAWRSLGGSAHAGARAPAAQPAPSRGRGRATTAARPPALSGAAARRSVAAAAGARGGRASPAAPAKRRPFRFGAAARPSPPPAQLTTIVAPQRHATGARQPPRRAPRPARRPGEPRAAPRCDGLPLTRSRDEIRYLER
jgi:hypothetical protein